MANIVGIDPQAELNAYGVYKFPLLGFLSVGTVLEGLGHKVEILCESFGSVYDALCHKLSPLLVERLRRAEFLVLSVMTPTAHRCYRIAEAAKKLFPRLKVIMGGPHVSFREEEALKSGADVVVKGEGELVINQALNATSGVVQAPCLIDDLNSLPFPDFSLIDGYQEWLSGRHDSGWKLWKKLYPRRFVPILGSRGCPFNCTFCIVTKMYGRRYRFREPGNVVEEMVKRIKEGAPPHFFFYDDNFAANPVRTKELLRLLKERIISKDGLGREDFRFVAEARADIAKDEELLRLLTESHCSRLFIGFESINPKALVAFRKRQTVKDIKQCVARLKIHGINVQGMFIIGADDDTLETIEETVDFALKAGIGTVQFSILFPIPGTELDTQLEKEGRILTRDWSLYDGTVVVFEPKLMTVRQLQESFLRAWQRFYLNWRKIKYLPAAAIGSLYWKKVHRASFENLVRRFKNLA